MCAATFSIVGYDPVTNEWGIAVQSKFLAVGSVVPWAQAGAGAVATQSYANTTFGPEGLKLLAEGKTAAEALEILIEGDPGRALRQVGIVDRQGNAASYTGEKCHDWAGGVTGRCYAQGNILVSEETVQAMARLSRAQKASWLSPLEALDAGQRRGDGGQAIRALVVQEKAGYGDSMTGSRPASG